MSKVRWDARSEDQFLQNYKVLQRVFRQKSIAKDIPCTRLVRAKYQVRSPLALEAA